MLSVTLGNTVVTSSGSWAKRLSGTIQSRRSRTVGLMSWPVFLALDRTDRIYANHKKMAEILIVGGGVFGLSTALSLARGKYKTHPEKILVIGLSERTCFS